MNNFVVDIGNHATPVKTLGKFNLTSRRETKFGGTLFNQTLLSEET